MCVVKMLISARAKREQAGKLAVFAAFDERVREPGYATIVVFCIPSDDI